MGKHSGRRARIGFTDSAIAQIDKLTEPEVHALDRALAALSVDPTMGEPIPGSNPELRRYTDDVEDVTVIFYVTALRSVIVVAYVEARAPQRKAPSSPHSGRWGPSLRGPRGGLSAVLGTVREEQ
ncbi:hypothetical protein ABZ383_00835 [Streptomyces sp. NPDC005900]|uniref:hypothetical protein n=1 Tax=Streptomyces sp. NPDC005900 TaxID=3154569 RepID=UPI0033D4944F